MKYLLIPMIAVSLCSCGTKAPSQEQVNQSLEAAKTAYSLYRLLNPGAQVDPAK